MARIHPPHWILFGELGRVLVAGSLLISKTTCRVVLNMLVSSLRVTVWNVNGNLALKIRDEGFIKFIMGSDVVFSRKLGSGPLKRIVCRCLVDISLSLGHGQMINRSGGNGVA